MRTVDTGYNRLTDNVVNGNRIIRQVSALFLLTVYSPYWQVT